MKLGLFKGGYVRWGPWSQPNIAPLNQTPSNKRYNKCETKKQMHLVYISSSFIVHYVNSDKMRLGWEEGKEWIPCN